jgi:hypothetical protein
VPLTWFEPLVEAGFFEGVPTVEEQPENGSWDGLRWPNVVLLRRAASDPSLRDHAWTVIEAVASSSNPPMHIDLVEIALESEPSYAARLVPFAREWIRDEGGLVLSDRVAKLVELLTQGGEVEAGFALAEAIIDLPGEQAK